LAESSISICGVSKSFGQTQAVRNLDLEVPRGSLCGFLGPNGAGKSTTIRMIMSIIYPDAGQITVLGGSTLGNKDRIGFLPEERGLYRKMRVGEFLAFMAHLKGVRGDVRKLAFDWLNRLELPGMFDKRCQELSKGMQQKVQVLASVIHNPDLIILDEPFSGLDPVNSAVLSRTIRELHAEGKTIIFSTHVLPQAEELCERIFLINHGVKLLDATMSEIRERFDPRTILVEPMTPNGDFRDVPGVVASRPLDQSRQFELSLEPNADPQLVMQAITSRTAVRSIELRRPTLSDVFVQLVMKDQGEAAAQQAREELTKEPGWLSAASSHLSEVIP